MAVVVIAAGLGARAVANGADDSWSAMPAGTAAPFDYATAAGSVATAYAPDWLDARLGAGGNALIEPINVAAEPEVPSVGEAAPTANPVVAPPPTRSAPPPARTAPPAAPAATPATCPATWFCYPRLGIAGPIVPYTDCSGATDVGTGIRSYTCLSDNYLMGHAYTDFGRVRQWAAGDIVFAWGKRFTVTGAVTEQSCAAPAFPLATLSLQTSLTSSACGAVLVVQAR